MPEQGANHMSVVIRHLLKQRLEAHDHPQDIREQLKRTHEEVKAKYGKA